MVHAQRTFDPPSPATEPQLTPLPSQVDTLDNYKSFFPDDVNTVDIIGVCVFLVLDSFRAVAKPSPSLSDYYPAAGALDFVSRFKPFHDEYCTPPSLVCALRTETTLTLSLLAGSDKLKFAIGETGLATGATMKDRLDWFKDTVSAETAAAMPHHMQVSWFNYVRRSRSFRASFVC